MNYSLALIAFVGAYSTAYIAKGRYFNPVKASAITSLVAYCMFYLLSNQVDLYSLLFFGGTFIGMSAPSRFGIYTIGASAIIFSILFNYLVPILDGYGGALGVSAFLSVCVCHLFILMGAPRSKK
ncbi:hypothetical protein J8L70_02075 [Pseudoalteromonas sp. MMG010]|uniref:hypothetical protein n=1 Tax=Pseudoalteromonas sp. MMG010 TaxID=2822685 RepID=UPI001B3A5FBB|nr:hypothetical protein [Pseudoalteromonas sp. MMG010]MBQ4832019.1 hypothetical protein [Pseudoalteromonas sp. MMG010]